MNKKIKVVMVRPGAVPYLTHISNSLENLQKIVGGYIETVTLATDLVIICNEEGRLKRMPFNCNVCGVEFVGPIIFAGVNEDEFSDIPCSFYQFKRMFKKLFALKGGSDET